MKALVIGATGAVGKDLVQQLSEDRTFERVDIFVRREVKIPAAKVVAHIVDYTYQYEAACWLGKEELGAGLVQRNAFDSQAQRPGRDLGFGNFAHLFTHQGRPDGGFQ